MAKPKTNNKNKVNSQHLYIKDIKPLTENQEKVFASYREGKHLLAHGSAGTGKTFLMLYLALRDLLEMDSDYDKIIILRSAVQSRKVGFLPGTEAQKQEVYEQPYVDIVNKLFNRGDAYSILKQKGYIEFESTSFLRGCTFDNSIVFIDEISNQTLHEADTCITRLGKHSKLLCAGDTRQVDFTNKDEKSGLVDIINIFKNMDSVDIIQFDTNDIVRSGFVKEYLIAREKLGL